jgi:hypothetical protein
VTVPLAADTDGADVDAPSPVISDASGVTVPDAADMAAGDTLAPVPVRTANFVNVGVTLYVSKIAPLRSTRNSTD